MPALDERIEQIEAACTDPDPACSNQRITLTHYSLSEALAHAIGRDAGPNFHTWAVWGSRKAGVTIRQEDLASAIRNATITAGLCGSVIGAVTGILIGRRIGWHNNLLTAPLGTLTGGLVGAWTGKEIAIWSRAKAARLILDGNRTVLRDIGEQSARFADLLENGAHPRDRAAFFAGLRPGPSERNGQDRLAAAFRSYLTVFDSSNIEERRAAMITGNCEIVFHEHIRLEPYIRGAMPWIIQRCATERMMSYEVGGRDLSVAQDVPGSSSHTAAKNWTNIEERMRYVFALFRQYHTAPEVFFPPDLSISRCDSLPED